MPKNLRSGLLAGVPHGMAFSLDIKKTARGTLPSVPFGEFGRSIFGPSYALSLVLSGDALARRMNRTYRKKSYVPNVLSFPLSQTDGEIILNVRKAAQEARRARVPFKERLAFLFVHACLHLKGLDHGKRMESLEAKYLQKFGFRADRNY